jgi:hypothetical protein
MKNLLRKKTLKMGKLSKQLYAQLMGPRGETPRKIWTRKQVVSLIRKYQRETGINAPGVQEELDQWINQNVR